MTTVITLGPGSIWTLIFLGVTQTQAVALNGKA